ncbi:uncharacterized protein LOC121736737 [Aricia agestis]|uniref:uncharacterized protein LOC121736737 n=1 Tax=Aricia agestis TaxID=91739 RepID=UPI001C209A42|nr:uncharacterized protein LOC121736737 [Aricia agestis]
MEHARPPPELCLGGNSVSRADAWKRWITQFHLFTKASGMQKEDSGVQDLEDELIRDRIVCGIRDKTLRDRMLRHEDLTLDAAIGICQVEEVSQESSRVLQAGPSRVDGVNARMVRFGSGGSSGAGSSATGGRRGGQRSWPQREHRVAVGAADAGVLRRGFAKTATSLRCRRCGGECKHVGECPAIVLDATSGFWSVKLDDESTDLCTFITPFGRYQYLRLPFGLNSAPEIFHAKIRWSFFSLLWLLIFVVVAEETPPGLVATDTEQDLIAEASQTGAQAQKRDAGLSNSYGEPLPPDAYGPPQNIPVVVQELQPAPVYGVPDLNVFQDPPPGAYGPPAPVIFPDQNYAGPPPPLGRPKPLYGPPKFHGPKQQYGPPKPVYGPPKKNYGPPKQNFPKFHGISLKPPKISFSKPGFGGGPKPIYGPPKPVYGPPKITYGTPLNVQSIPVQNIPLAPPPQTFGSSTNFGHIGIGHGDIGIGTIGTQFGSLEASVGTSIGTNDLNLNLPAPIYGTPLPSLPLDLKPNFPIPADTYGPPGHSLGPIGPNDQIVIQNFDNIGHYGPPQPDPNPQPPHPGIPAPPTPPHVLYDGWKPIPGVSKPNYDNYNVNTLQSIESLSQTGGNIENLDQYGPPPQIQEVINVEGQSLPNVNQNVHFHGPQVNTGYSSVHQDALANIDLNAIVGGDSNHIDQSKTIYEAHYTDNGQNQDLNLIQAVPEKPVEVYSLPSAEGESNGHYQQSFRQLGAKGLNAPSGVYGVPPGSQYGAPPKPLPANLPIPYGTYSGGGHTGGPHPRHPVKFRESVPEGLIQQIGHVSHHKDAHGIDEISQHPAYLPPPIRDVKDINQQTGNHGYSVQIEPSSLYSLPHSGNPISFQVLQQQPSNLYGSPIDSYAAPLLTVADHTASGSSNNEIAATLDGTILGNLSNLDAAAILKHCPYHEAILKAAQRGERIPSDLASKYVASLRTLGSTLQKGQQSSAVSVEFGASVAGRDSGKYSAKDQDTGSQTIVETVLPNHIESDKNKAQKGKMIKDSYKHNIQQVTEQIKQTSEKIKAVSETTKSLQQNIESGNQIINQNGQYQFGQEIPVKGNLASYSIQIQSANSDGKSNTPSVPHNQLLSEDLLQSILQAIEQPRTNQAPNKVEIDQSQSKLNNQQYVVSDSNPSNDQSFGIPNADQGGLVLPEGYEPVDRSNKDNKQQKDQETQSSNTSIKQLLQGEAKNKHKEFSDCDLRPDNSITHTIVVPAPGIETVQRVDEVEDNEVAIFFGEDAKDDKDEKTQETVTEISVATSISENLDNREKKPEFGEKIKKDS